MLCGNGKGVEELTRGVDMTIRYIQYLCLHLRCLMPSHVKWTEHATTTVVMIEWQEAITQQIQKAMKWHASGEEGGVLFMPD